MFKIDQNKCIKCKSCIKDCPTKTITFEENSVLINNDNCILCGHCYAICPIDAVISDNTPEELKPYNISADDFLNFIKSKRSIRQFKNKSIEKEIIEKLVEAGRFTATGRNLQDVRYIAVTDEIETLRELTLKALSSFGKELLKDRENRFSKYAKLFINMYKSYNNSKETFEDRLFFNAPLVLIFVSKDLTNGVLASKNIDNMTTFMNLGGFYSGFFTKACAHNKELRDFLNLKDDEIVSACLVIGYPKISYKRGVSRKKATISWR